MSSKPISQHPVRRQTRIVLCLAALGVIGASAAAQAQSPDYPRPQESAGSWTRMLAVDLTARELGLPAGSSAPRLARAALERNARRLGLRDSLASLRLEGRLRLPAADGARALEQLRFQQSAGPLRVVWSQIDVMVAAGRVGSISATVVPVEAGPAAGERRVSRKRALAIALQAVPGAEKALRPLPAAYAGAPSTERAGEPRLARRVWVVEVQPASGSEEGVEEGNPTDLCIVVDAETGKVIGRWPGMADRPDSGPDARGAGSDPLNGAAALRDPRDGPASVLNVFNGTDGTNDFSDPQFHYANFTTTGATRVSANWPSYQQARRPGATPTDATEAIAMEAISANAANVARTICVVRGYCGSTGGFQPGADSFLLPWSVIGNVPGTRSSVSPFSFNVSISQDDVMRGNGDPNVPANDVVAHEFGHLMDYVYAGDRFVGPDRTTDEVQEALADMFAYEYDRFDATFAEETGSGTSRNWADPAAERLLGQAYPAHMDDYDPTPPVDAPHFNSTILSHAYYLLVQRIGHGGPGACSTTCPSSSPRGRPSWRSGTHSSTPPASSTHSTTRATPTTIPRSGRAPSWPSTR